VLVLANKPGHDGAVAALDDSKLLVVGDIWFQRT
jgi:hypothetical protein